jgi:hypothetical protein
MSVIMPMPFIAVVAMPASFIPMTLLMSTTPNLDIHTTRIPAPDATRQH